MSVQVESSPVAHPRKKYWWIVLLQGMAVIVLSLFLFFKPTGTIFLITIFLGVYLIINGLIDMLFAVLGDEVNGRLVTFLKGIFSMLLGGFILLMPIFFVSTLATWFFVLVALTLIVFGAIRIFLKRQDIGKRRVTDILVGILMVVLGFMMFAAPFMTMELIVALLAVWGGITGIFMIFDAFELRSL